MVFLSIFAAVLCCISGYTGANIFAAKYGFDKKKSDWLRFAYSVVAYVLGLMFGMAVVQNDFSLLEGTGVELFGTLSMLLLPVLVYLLVNLIKGFVKETEHMTESSKLEDKILATYGIEITGRVEVFLGVESTAEAGVLIRAYRGSVVFVKSGAIGVAYPGSTLHAKSGSVVLAYGGSTVYAENGSRVSAREGASFMPKIRAYSGESGSRRRSNCSQRLTVDVVPNSNR